MVKLISNQTDEDDDFYNELLITKIVIPIIYTSIVIFGLIGNLLVVYVVIKSNEYRRSTVYVYIIHLAFCDIFFLLFCLPVHTVIFVHDTWPFGDIACRLVHFIMFLTMQMSAFLGLSISFDRYLATSSDIWVRNRRTQLRTQLICGCLWVASIIISSPWLAYYKLKIYSYNDDENMTISTQVSVCSFAFPSKETQIAMRLSTTLLGYVIPAIFIVIFSSLLIVKLWIRPQYNENVENIQQKRYVTTLVTVTVFTFLVCWLPYHCCVIYYLFAPQRVKENIDIFLRIRMFAHAISYANSCMNPIIYNFLSRNFQRGFAKIFRRPVRNQFRQPQELIELNSNSARNAQLQRTLIPRYRSTTDVPVYATTYN